MRKTVLIGCLAVLVIPLVACGIYSWLIRREPFPIETVALPAELFPEDVIYNRMIPPSEYEPGAETGGQTIYWSGGDGLAIYIVKRFLTERGVKQWFQSHVDRYASLAPTEVGGLQPHTFSTSLTADPYYTGCGLSEFIGYRCLYVAIYDHYFVYLNVKIDKAMPVEQFDRIVYAVDELLSTALAGAR